MSLVNIPRRLFTHDYCPTGKRAHATRAEAMVHLRGLLLSADHRPGVMNVYACPYCEANAVCAERDRLEAECDRQDALQEAEDLIAGRRAV